MGDTERLQDQPWEDRAVGAPTGTVTFLFTDIEGSTRRWQEDEAGMRAALTRHDKILRGAIEDCGGVVFSTMGDGMAAAFAHASDAISAALGARDALVGVLPVRFGVHTGEAELRDGDYFGTAVNRCARLMAAAHGGQVIVSDATAGVVRDTLPVSLVDLGEHRLRDLSRPIRVFQVGEGRFPPLRTLEAFPGNLPLQVSSFVGRERELERVSAALAAARVVTLTGVGGVGKTRLALQASGEVLPRFSDGAWLVELAPVRDPEMVPDAVGAVFDVVPRTGQSVQQALIEFLRGKQLLLLMDNCEHLLEPVAELIDALLRSCPRLQVLATSREGLGIDGEQMLAVPSLPSPKADASFGAVAEAASVRLFAERAQAVKAEFSVTPENALAVGQVCRRLDGVPLAIELAAARVPAMSPAELARRLERRFEVLAGGRRGAVERHQTLRATIDWSYELLNEAQRRLLARLTVFAGGCTPEAAEAVCAGGPVDADAVWELVASLVARSLVVAEDHRDGTRYRLLETIRQYGEERLDEHGESAELRRRHARYYTELLATLCDVGYSIALRAESLTQLADEQDNIALAMAWALDSGDVDLAFHLLSHAPNTEYQMDRAFRLTAEPVLALPGAEDHPAYPLGLAIAAMQAAIRGDLAVGERLCELALAAEARLHTHSGRLVDQAVAWARSGMALAVGAWREGAAQQERAADIARTAGNVAEAAMALSGAAALYALDGAFETAIPLATDGVELARRIGSPLLLAHCLTALAQAISMSEPQRARQLLRERSDINAALGYEQTADVTQAVLVAARLGDRRLTLELAARAVPRLHWNGDRPQLAGVLNVVAWATSATEPHKAAVLQGSARTLALSAIAGSAPVRGEHAVPAPRPPAGGSGLIAGLRRETTHRLAESLGQDRLTELRAEGEALDADGAVALALNTIDEVLTSR